METNPANTVIHHWHHDPDFALSPGRPRPLPFDGPASFTTLVAKYAGDIPPGAMRMELCRAGTVEEAAGGLLVATHRFFSSVPFDEDFIRRISFALENLGATVVHNAELHQAPGFSEEMNEKLGRFERCAWTEHLRPPAAEAFRAWVRREGARFTEQAISWIGEHELPKSQWKNERRRTVGVGVYYFEEDV
jgi:hypothetical protein